MGKKYTLREIPLVFEVYRWVTGSTLISIKPKSPGLTQHKGWIQAAGNINNKTSTTKQNNKTTTKQIQAVDKMSWTTFFSLLSIIGVAYGCTCAGTIIEDGNTGRNIGECLTQLQGRYWCYVNPNIWCSDKTLSSRSTGGIKLYYSFEACSSQSTESTPSIAAQESFGVPQQRTRNPPIIARARRNSWQHN